MSATISACGQYRYDLWRTWNPAWPLMAFIMLNPSTADAEIDDPTIRRCIQFAKDEGCGRIVVGNLFAYRSTDPAALKLCSAPIGPANDTMLESIMNAADIIVCAWGAHGKFRNRGDIVLRQIKARGKVPHCLRLTKRGQPEHPLYLPSALRPFPMIIPIPE